MFRLLISRAFWDMTDETSSDVDRAGELAGRLRAIASQGGELDIAQFQFVGFDEIARAYGARWTDQQERVKETAHAYIKRRLGERDLLVRGADGFLIVYADQGREQSRSHAEEVKDGLNAFYLGEGATRPPVEMSVRHARLPVQELIQSIAGMEVSAADRKASTGDMMAGVEWKFQPVWHARREAIFNYYVSPILRETGARVPGYQFDMDLEREFDFRSIDEMSLAQSEVALRKMVREGKRSLLGVCVHSSSLLKQADRNRTLRVMDTFNRDLMRYRIIQIGATPSGFPRMYLEDIFRELKQRVPNIAISVGWNEADIRSLLQLEPAAIGFTVSPWALGEHASVSPQELLVKVKQAAGIARAAKVPFYFDGEAERELVAKLRDAGVDLVSSPRIWPLQDEPQGTQLWPSERLAA